MKTKFLIPVLAAIFAIGMSFTTVKDVTNPSQDYILQNGNFMPVGSELNCGTGSKVCQVQFEQNGPVYDVYDAENTSTLKRGAGQIIRLWE